MDREAVSELSLKVLAMNHGPLGGNDTDMATVRVLVRDANDPPLFTERLYEGVVRENSQAGTSVLKVSAIVLLVSYLVMVEGYSQCAIVFAIATNHELFNIEQRNNLKETIANTNAIAHMKRGVMACSQSVSVSIRVFNSV